jgi:hypothetical protein
MTAATLVETIRARGIALIADGGRLGVRPAVALTFDERRALRRLKPEIVRLLTAEAGPARACCTRCGVDRLLVNLYVLATEHVCPTCMAAQHATELAARLDYFALEVPR